MDIAREVLYRGLDDSVTWRRMIFQNLERNIEREIINYVKSISLYNSEISKLERELNKKVYEEL